MEIGWTILYNIGIAQGVFLIFALLLLKDKRKLSIRLLLGLLICMLSLLVAQFMAIQYSVYELPISYRTGETIPLLIGPLLYLYIITVVKPDKKLKQIQLLHFVPFVFFLLLFLPFYLKSDQSKIESIATVDEHGPSMGVVIFSWFKGLHNLVYVVLSLIYVRKHHLSKPKKNRSGYNPKLLYRFLLIQLAGILIIYVLVVLESLTPELNPKPDRIASLIVTFFFFAFAFTIILFSKAIIPDDQQQLEKQRYKDSTLSDGFKQSTLNKLTEILQNEKPYLNPELTLSDLADSLEIGTNQLSQVINEKLNKNFYQLINEYRIEEVKQQIDDDHRTLYGIALDCGFSSKSTFNRSFKEVTGLTPSQYKKSI